MNPSQTSKAVPSKQCTRVLTFPWSDLRCSLSSRTCPRSVRSSSLSSKAPVHCRMSRWCSSPRMRTSSATICMRSTQSCCSRRRSPSASMQTSTLPWRYLWSSCKSCWLCMHISVSFALSVIHADCMSFTLRTASRTSFPNLAESEAICFISWRSNWPTISSMFRTSFCSRFLSRMSASITGLISLSTRPSSRLTAFMISSRAAPTRSSKRVLAFFRCASRVLTRFSVDLCFSS
mmetsp:Transcript_51288/g.130400  ORF Transcript_51288/g.130400 Transcript_51288/m.130400 type:complete len:234 (-) Transcript_51288:340-1041(-)